MHSEKIFWAASLKFINWAPHINDLSVRNYSDRKIEMTHFESGFLCGLLKRERPKKILEVGVAAGGTSAVLLKSISMLNLNTKLYSVDLCHKYYANPSLDVGYIVKETVPDLMQNWNLFTGNVVSEYLEKIGSDIDFCILDTMHTLPGELLDFLCVLPYLKQDAMVVLHDTALHFLSPEFSLCYATQVLMSVVVADKIYPCDIQNIENIANIGAFKVNSNTYKYIENVFGGLRMPWNYIPDDISLVNFDKFFAKHYNNSLCNIFRQATNINAELKNNKFKFDLNANDYIKTINKTNYPQKVKKYTTKKIMQDRKEELNLTPLVTSHDIYLCFSCDVKYLQHFVVALTSILHNASQEDNLIIYFISNELSPQDIELILSLKNIRNFEIKFISVTAEKFKAFPVNLHVSVAAYFRLLIPEIIPSHVDKILYLDCDILVEKSLYDLYNTNIDNYYLAAVEDFSSYGSMQYNEENYRIYREKYFNSGVMLLNLKRLRSFSLYKKSYEFIKKFGQPRWWDQDILNMLFETKDILFIPPYFNMQYWYSDAGLRADEYLIGNTYAKLHDIAIIHFITDIKPWINITFSHASNIFVKKYYFYLRLSCFCGKVQSFPLGIPYNSHILLLGVDPIGLDICKKKILKIQSDANIVTKFFENYTQLETYYINYNKFDAIFILQYNSINGVGFSYLKENNKCSLFLIDKNCENIIQVSTPNEHKVFGVCEQTPPEGQIPSINSYNFSTESPNKFFANIRNQIKLLRYRILSKITFRARSKHYKTKKQKLKNSINKNLMSDYITCKKYKLNVEI